VSRLACFLLAALAAAAALLLSLALLPALTYHPEAAMPFWDRAADFFLEAFLLVPPALGLWIVAMHLFRRGLRAPRR
jgi:hypothetical protein